VVPLTDTSPEAERILIEAYRQMSPGRKWLRLGELYRDARLLHAAGVRRRNPAATPRDILVDWLEIHLGYTLPVTIPEPTMDEPLPSLHDVRAVARVLVQLGIPYALGGSMASSTYGISRHTADADITVEPFPGREADLIAAFGPNYYASLPAIQDAVRRRSSFNIIDTARGFKVDLFVRKDDPFEQSAMDRRVSLEFPDAPGQPLMVQSPEDLVLFKLRWYRLGNETSEQQWKDVLGVLKVQAGKLDVGYLERWAPHVGVEDLLARARQESQPPPAP
jgi:hypothetical protein